MLYCTQTRRILLFIQSGLVGLVDYPDDDEEEEETTEDGETPATKRQRIST